VGSEMCIRDSSRAENFLKSKVGFGIDETHGDLNLLEIDMVRLELFKLSHYYTIFSLWVG
jgi:hypothetical protein